MGMQRPCPCVLHLHHIHEDLTTQFGFLTELRWTVHERFNRLLRLEQLSRRLDEGLRRMEERLKSLSDSLLLWDEKEKQREAVQKRRDAKWKANKGAGAWDAHAPAAPLPTRWIDGLGRNCRARASLPIAV